MRSACALMMASSASMRWATVPVMLFKVSGRLFPTNVVRSLAKPASFTSKFSTCFRTSSAIRASRWSIRLLACCAALTSFRRLRLSASTMASRTFTLSAMFVPVR